MTDQRDTPFELTIRDVVDGDAQALLAIYNHEVLNGTRTLDIEPRTLALQAEWIHAHQGASPALVAEVAGEVVGFASLQPYKSRAAYRTTVENSIYVSAGSQGRGVGNALLEAIIGRASQHGYHSIIARVIGDNPGSVALHQRHGYTVVGVEREVGRKFAKWHDVTILQLLI